MVLIPPGLGVDGRDRMVDPYNYRKENPDKAAPPLVYWGHYVAHDNNRDGLGMALALSRNQMKTFIEYHPTILHDPARRCKDRCRLRYKERAPTRGGHAKSSDDIR